MNVLVSIILAYLIGSISCAILISRALKTPDPRTHGSKNAGATNMLRTAGKQAAIYVGIADALKGLIAVIIAQILNVQNIWLACVALVVVLGHVFPLYFNFKGGKGVATMMGALLGLSFWIGILTIATWVIIIFAFRYSSLASLAAAIGAPIYTLIAKDFYYFFPVLAITVLLIWKHWDNINRLRRGVENKIHLPNARNKE